MNIMEDVGQAPQARLKAAELVLKWSGEVGDKGKNPEDKKNLSDMSVEELNELVDSLHKRQGKLVEHVITP
jgi:hypothetical protein